MSFIENIKLIASELANMSPRTQLEIVKLCKELCIETKNYLVDFDENKLPLIDAKLQALETATNNLNTLYNALAEELQTAEGNITANANAIELLQSSVQAITEALEGIYTKSQVDALLSAKADKLDTYTKTEVDTALSGKASLSGNNTFTGTNNLEGRTYLKNDVENYGAIEVYLDSDATLKLFDTEYLLFDNSNDTLKDKLDAKQDELTAGSGISIVNNVISATGGGGSSLYRHRIHMTGDAETGGSFYLYLDIYNTNNAQLTLQDIITLSTSTELPILNGYESNNGYGIFAIRYITSEQHFDLYTYDDNSYGTENINFTDTITQII